MKSFRVLPLIAAMSMMGTYALAADEKTAGPPPALVEIDTARVENIAEQLWVPATVMSRTDSNIAAEVSGRISWMADVGDLVQKGEVLAKLDDRLLQLEQQQHQANIAKWSARVDLLERKMKRFSTMAEQKAASRDQLDEVESELEIARQELTQAKINMQQTEYQLSQTQVKAPFTAMVVERLQTPGEYTGVGNNLLRIVDTENVEASVKAPLSVAAFIQPGLQVAVKGSRLEKNEQIRTIVPVGNARSRMMEVRVALKSGDFPIGSAVRVALPGSEYRNATTVDRDALVLRQNGTYIFTIDEQEQAQQVPVVTGIGVGERIEISGNVNDGNKVVVRGAERLRPGQKVRYNEAEDTEVARL